MKSNVVLAAVAGGLVLGAAAFLPMGAQALQGAEAPVATAQHKLAAPTSNDALEVGPVADEQTVQAAGVDPIASPDPTVTPDPTSTSTPVATPPLTFAGGDDDGDDSGHDGQESDEQESDD